MGIFPKHVKLQLLMGIFPKYVNLQLNVCLNTMYTFHDVTIYINNFVNLFIPKGIPCPYQLDESISNLSVVE